MKKIILGIVIGAVISFAGYALATPTEVKYTIDNGIEFLRGEFGAGSATIESFYDKNAGITCYISTDKISGYVGGHISAISCVKTN